MFEVPLAGDDEDDEDDEDPSVNGVVKTRPLGVFCSFFGIDCWVMLVCGRLLDDAVSTTLLGMRKVMLVG